jgi:hypothetical protein
MEQQPSPTSPLLEIGLSFIGEFEKPLMPEQTCSIRDVLTFYLSGRIEYQECVILLMPVLGPRSRMKNSRLSCARPT